jgi:hypothetical protein
VGSKAHAVVKPGHGLVVVGSGVAGGDQDAGLHQPADVFRLVALRRQGDLGDGVRVGAEEIDHLVGGLADLLGRVDPLRLRLV